MIKYKILNYKTCWDGDVWLGDVPSDGYVACIKNPSKAKEFYKESENSVEIALDTWGYKYEKHGESEEDPSLVQKKKNVRRKKGK